MHKGQITNMGTYEELKNDSRFKRIIKHMTKTSDEKNDENMAKNDNSLESNKNKLAKNYLSENGHKTVEHEEDEEFELSYQTYLNYVKY